MVCNVCGHAAPELALVGARDIRVCLNCTIDLAGLALDRFGDEALDCVRRCADEIGHNPDPERARAIRNRLYGRLNGLSAVPAPMP